MKLKIYMQKKMEQIKLFEEPKKCKVVHVKKSNYDVYCARPGIWGNPYSHKEGTLAKFKVETINEAIEKFREYLLNNKELMDKLPELKGKTLGCWCVDENGKGKCHAKVIAELVNNL